MKPNQVDPNPIPKTPQTQAIHQMTHPKIQVPAPEKIEEGKNPEAMSQRTKNKENNRKKIETKMTEKTRMIKARIKIKAKEARVVTKVNKESPKTEMKKEGLPNKRNMKNMAIKMINMENNNQKIGNKDKKEAVPEVKKDNMKKRGTILNIKKIKIEDKTIKEEIKSKTIKTLKEVEVNLLTDSMQIKIKISNSKERIV